MFHQILRHFGLFRVGGHLVLLVTVAQAIFGEMFDAEDPTARFWTVFYKARIVLIAHTAQLALPVHLEQSLRLLDGLVLGLVQWPHLVQSDLGISVKAVPNGRFVVVVGINDDLLIAEVDCKEW